MNSIEMPSLNVAHVPHTLPLLLAELSKMPALLDAAAHQLGISPFDLCRTLGDGARLMEALRLGLAGSNNEADLEDWEMTVGEKNMARMLGGIFARLGLILASMERKERRENPQATANHPSWPKPDNNKKG